VNVSASATESVAHDTVVMIQARKSSDESQTIDDRIGLSCVVPQAAYHPDRSVDKGPILATMLQIYGNARIQRSPPKKDHHYRRRTLRSAFCVGIPQAAAQAGESGEAS
jgi:hypothetical protein